VHHLGRRKDCKVTIAGLSNAEQNHYWNEEQGTSGPMACINAKETVSVRNAGRDLPGKAIRNPQECRRTDVQAEQNVAAN
jgi:hypothetical protein